MHFVNLIPPLVKGFISLKADPQTELEEEQHSLLHSLCFLQTFYSLVLCVFIVVSHLESFHKGKGLILEELTIGE